MPRPLPQPMLLRPFPPRRGVRALPAGLLVLAVLLPISYSAESTDPGDLKSQADRWIELEIQIAAERNQWESEKEILQNSRDVLQKEQEALEAKLEANELATSLFRARFESAEANLAQLEAAHELLRTQGAAVESRLRSLLPRLPEPLRASVDPQFLKLDNRTGENAISVSEATQTLVAILSTVDRFNNSLTLTHQLRTNAAGEILDVKVLYWGLALAYAVDARGEGAWMLVPGPDGWEWQDQRENASAISALMAVYEKQQSPRLIALPASLQGGAQ